MTSPLTDSAREMLARPNPSVIATTRKDGQPVSATGNPYPTRDRARVSALIEVDRVHGWGAQKNNDQAGGDD